MGSIIGAAVGGMIAGILIGIATMQPVDDPQCYLQDDPDCDDWAIERATESAAEITRAMDAAGGGGPASLVDRDWID